MPFCIQGDVGLYTIEHTLTHTHTQKHGMFGEFELGANGHQHTHSHL
jgi:hypothetical protein